MNNISTQLDSSIFDDFEGITSVYELRRTLELDVKGQEIRIELWYWHSNPNCRWDGRVYSRNEGAQNWKPLDGFPWAQGRDEEETLRSALDSIERRFQERAGGGFQKSVK